MHSGEFGRAEGDVMCWQNDDETFTVYASMLMPHAVTGDGAGCVLHVFACDGGGCMLHVFVCAACCRVLLSLEDACLFHACCMCWYVMVEDACCMCVVEEDSRQCWCILAV